jgi:hypothetical protein
MFTDTDFATTTTGKSSELFVNRIAAGVEIVTPKITTKGLTVENIDSLNDIINLQSDVEFFGRPYFTKDTAGFAVIKQGDKSVDVTFDRDYLEQPIVNTSISLEGDETAADNIFNNNIQFVVIKKSVHGFTIILNKAATSDVNFSWTAFAVKSAKTFSSISTPPDNTSGGNTANTGGTATDTATSTGDTSTTTNNGTSTSTDNGTSTTTTPVTPAAPNVVADDVLNTVSGMDNTMEYNIDNTGYVVYGDGTSFNGLDLSGDHTILVRVADDGMNGPGDITTLNFTTN